MAIKDFGKGLKSSLHDAVDTVKAKAKEVEDFLRFTIYHIKNGGA